MDRFGEWRPIPPAATDDGDESPSKSAPANTAEPARPEANVMSVRLAGLLCAGALAVVGVVLWLGAGSGEAQPSLEVSGAAGYFRPGAATPTGMTVPAATAGPAIVVDVQGAVARPGVHRLPPGSRVGDAIAAAGGYSQSVDITAAAALLNLAAPLADGAKVHVPARGEANSGTGAGGPVDPEVPGGAVGGSTNINTASADELDTLPGIGPVTAAEIIEAREAMPFSSVDELLSREVVGAATFEKIRDLVTTGP